MVAELVFHAGPLALVALVAGLVSTRGERARQLGRFAASVIEPVPQVLWGSAHSPPWANAYVGAHLLVFDRIEVHLFRRYGFLTMYLCRVAYDGIGHVAWGHARLALLFRTTITSGRSTPSWISVRPSAESMHAGRSTSRELRASESRTRRERR